MAALPLDGDSLGARAGTDAPDPLLGAAVGSFRLVRILGAGGMGTVYLGEHPVIRSQVAIKFLHPWLARDPDTLRRFLDEARVVNELAHENLVRVLDLGVLPPDRHYLVMELLSGETLESFLGGGAVPPEVAVPILGQLCAALQCAHDRGVVHRDVKPENVFLTRSGGHERFVKLVDFGVAKLPERADHAGATSAGAIIGTPQYMAPEQCAGLPATPACDLYSVGVIAFRLLTGALPFSAPSVVQLLAAHLEQPPPDPALLCPELPRALAAVILRALAKDPKARFASVRELAAALAAAGREAPAPAPASSGAAAGPLPTAPVAADGSIPVTVLLPDGECLSLGCAQLLVGGALLCGATSPPPLLARLKLRFARPPPQPELTVQATVVRHVTAEEARAWGASPGFAVDFGGLDTATRVALRQLAASAPRQKPPAAEPGPTSAQTHAACALLARHRGTASQSPYELLGLRLDADAAAVRASGLRLLHELGTVRQPGLPEEVAAELAALLDRVRVAMRVLCHVGTRLEVDARLGNFLGVARCLGEGLPLEELRRRRGQLPQQSPASTARIRRAIFEGVKAEAEGDLGAARALYEDALRLDPLHDELHGRYARLRRSA